MNGLRRFDGRAMKSYVLLMSVCVGGLEDSMDVSFHTLLVDFSFVHGFFQGLNFPRTSGVFVRFTA